VLRGNKWKDLFEEKNNIKIKLSANLAVRTAFTIGTTPYSGHCTVIKIWGSRYDLKI
jgi:hypothetical protein